MGRRDSHKLTHTQHLEKSLSLFFFSRTIYAFSAPRDIPTRLPCMQDHEALCTIDPNTHYTPLKYLQKFTKFKLAIKKVYAQTKISHRLSNPLSHLPTAQQSIHSSHYCLRKISLISDHMKKVIPYHITIFFST